MGVGPLPPVARGDDGLDVSGSPLAHGGAASTRWEEGDAADARGDAKLGRRLGAAACGGEGGAKGGGGRVAPRLAQCPVETVVLGDVLCRGATGSPR